GYESMGRSTASSSAALRAAARKAVSCGAGPPGDLHSFPTRRSSDLPSAARPAPPVAARSLSVVAGICLVHFPRRAACQRQLKAKDRKSTRLKLQSRENLVCRLLLEKKKRRRDQRWRPQKGRRRRRRD